MSCFVKYCVWGIVALSAAWPVAAAAAERGAAFKPPPYLLERASEDYGYLRDPALRTDVWDPVKYLPLTGDGSSYLSLGGEMRERYEYFNRPNWGKDPQDHGYLLQRYFLHGDLHLGGQIRLFTQLQSSLEDGRKGGPRPADEDELVLPGNMEKAAAPASPLE